jgi:hypothetical protein
MHYEEFMRTSDHKEDLKLQYKQYDQLLGQLTNHWMNYASHKQTGIVYDTDIIKQKLNELRMRIDE